jgi:hypothetical protein
MRCGGNHGAHWSPDAFAGARSTEAFKRLFETLAGESILRRKEYDTNIRITERDDLWGRVGAIGEGKHVFQPTPGNGPNHHHLGGIGDSGYLSFTNKSSAHDSFLVRFEPPYVLSRRSQIYLLSSTALRRWPIRNEIRIKTNETVHCVTSDDEAILRESFDAAHASRSFSS